jgi:hypothetical protein
MKIALVEWRAPAQTVGLVAELLVEGREFAVERHPERALA